MGNKISIQSNSNDNDNIDPNKMKLPNILDHIATKLITSSTFQDMENLHDPDYCNKILLLTSKVIDKHANHLEISFLDQRTKNGIIVDKMERKPVIYLAKQNIDTMDVQSKLKKQRMCKGVARFYVKIAHIFAAISKTINPMFSYIDTTGQTKTVPLIEKKNIPKGAQIKFKKLNLCSRRIAALKPVQNNENAIVIKGKNCNMNKKVNPISHSMVGGNPFEPDDHGPLDNGLGETHVPTSTLGGKNLLDEIGMPELEKLYYDIYNFNPKSDYGGDGKNLSAEQRRKDKLNQGFYKMSDESRKQYYADLLKFYQTFTGNDKITEDELTAGDPKKGRPPIKKFSQIKLLEFHNQTLCTQADSPWTKSYRGDPKSKLFAEYANHLKFMIKHSKEKETKLLAIFEKIFSYFIDPKTKEKGLTIKPNLTIKKLDTITKETRDIIIELYLDCEKDFQKGLQIFESIVKNRMLERTKLAVENFDGQVNKLMENKNIVKKPLNRAANPVIPPPIDKSIPMAPDASFPNSHIPVAAPIALPLPPPISYNNQPNKFRI